MTYEEHRENKIKASELIGNYYRAISLYLNGAYTLCPDHIPLDLESKHGKYLMNRAITQFGKLEYTRDHFIKMRCNYCKKTYRINDIDNHERQCDQHD